MGTDLIPWSPSAIMTSDGNHPIIDRGDEWRSGNSLKAMATRFCSYGNWAGPSNRMTVENHDEINRRRAIDPTYDPYHEERLSTGIYAPVDPIDEAAYHHDHSYYLELGEDNPYTPEHEPEKGMFTWAGLEAAAVADETLADAVYEETRTNHDAYSWLTLAKADGLDGFFSSRANAVHGIHWLEDKAEEATTGIADWIGSTDWSTTTGIGTGVVKGLVQSSGWLADTANQAAFGVSEAVSDIGRLGPFGLVNAAAGYTSTACAYGAHLAGEAWNGATDLVGGAADKLGSLADDAWDLFGG